MSLPDPNNRDGLALALLLLVCPIVMVCYFSTLDGGDPSTDTATVLEQLHVLTF
jgi:hypothetical protein